MMVAVLLALALVVPGVAAEEDDDNPFARYITFTVLEDAVGEIDFHFGEVVVDNPLPEIIDGDTDDGGAPDADEIGGETPPSGAPDMPHDDSDRWLGDEWRDAEPIMPIVEEPDGSDDDGDNGDNGDSSDDVVSSEAEPAD
jgi:hypothetical protein